VPCMQKKRTSKTEQKMSNGPDLSKLSAEGFIESVKFLDDGIKHDIQMRNNFILERQSKCKHPYNSLRQSYSGSYGYKRVCMDCGLCETSWSFGNRSSVGYIGLKLRDHADKEVPKVSEETVNSYIIRMM
jgi:hypothetical protein